MRAASKILMVRPAAFGFNTETASSNAFQSSDEFSQDLVLEQFDTAVAALRQAGIEVLVINDEPQPPKPDAIFPNNWFSVVEGKFHLYPMYAHNRRLERRPDIQLQIESTIGHKMEPIDWSAFEDQGLFLEGTGSLVLDRHKRVVYAVVSPRTDRKLVKEWAVLYGYESVVFHALDSKGQAIYHTNVVMGIGEKWALVCLDCIVNPDERLQLTGQLIADDKDIISISREQMNNFAGNCLELFDKNGESRLVISRTAWNSLSDMQKMGIGAFSKPMVIDVSEIERIGGGSIRCMMAELE